MSHDPIDDAFQKRHELNIALSREYIAELESDVAALRAELAQHKAALPTCEKHKPDRGARSGCVICSGNALSHALSRIDYVCGEPNEMECSDYDVHYNEDEVVKRVVALRAEVEWMREAVDEYALGDERYKYVRRLNVMEFAKLYQRNIKEGIPFDDLIDLARKESRNG